jgi:hypothetical protein
MTLFDSLPTHAPPAGPDCQCRFCFLWGYMGPLPPGTPTAKNPAPRPERGVEESPLHPKGDRNLFSEADE